MMALSLSGATLGLLAWLPPATPPCGARRAHVRLQEKYEYDSKTFNPELSGLNPQANSATVDWRPEGSHGTSSRFMPVTTVSKESAPAVVCIAGVYPGVTAEQLQRPTPVPFAPAGKWNYHMLTGDAAPGGFVAIPGSPLLDMNPDTVAVVCASRSLGLEFPDNAEHEVLALIHRGDAATVDRTALDNTAFYALADAEGKVHIRWINDLPPDWRVVGRVLFTQMPFVQRPGAASGFAEMSDEFEF